MEKLAGDTRDMCSRAERAVSNEPNKYFGYAERVADASGGAGGVFLCRRSHEMATLVDEEWTLRTLTSS